MSRDTLRIGLLFSATGSYAALGAAMRAGAELAIDEVNADPSAPVRLDPVPVDPGGVTAAYADGALALLRDHGVTHVFGCYTSSSRKEVLPVFEKHDGLLWYPSHYEGFETSDNVIYTGAAPNQHIVPLARHLLARHGNRGWFVGSNYVWAWENNRILREALMEAGGAVMGERYFPVGETDLGALAAQIVRDRPDFVFTTLIGESGYQFFRLLREAAERAGLDQPRDLPVASCSLSEVELPFIGAAAEGHLSSSVYFSTIDSPQNARFAERWNARFGYLGQACADAEATYIAVHMLVGAVARAGATGLAAVREAVRGLRFDAPQGPVEIDPDNLHCQMRPRIGRSTAAGTFEIIFEEAQPVRPDPYLVWVNAPQAGRGEARRPDHLRLVT
ncbi:MAG: transporter substrate-binding domain-containing protein [Rhodobacteraceae bacterium]|jgi:branched-chain amino acid transport system substrate-binding protein|nr:transporter substrate-binding domain-containing protein [Paracoccaceae bacterium]